MRQMTPQEAIDHLESTRVARDRIPGLMSMVQYFRKNDQAKDADALTMILALAKVQMEAPMVVAKPQRGCCRTCAAWDGSFCHRHPDWLKTAARHDCWEWIEKHE